MGFFADPDADAQLEADNVVFWDALLAFVEEDLPRDRALTVLDVGCHRGGLLKQLATRWPVAKLIGVEPSVDARETARRRLSGLNVDVSLLPPETWCDVPPASVDVITCHEVLYLIEDLPALFRSFRRALRPDGAAYAVFGCHTENPVWPTWSKALRVDGIKTFDFSPMDVLRFASDAALSASVRPLRRDGWVRYDPRRATFSFDSATQLFDHHYRHKLLVRMVPR